MNKLEILKKKLLYRSNYRGTKEMDILLSSFVKKYINEFSKSDLLDLEVLLETEDEIISGFYYSNIESVKIYNNKVTKLLKEFKF